MRKLDSSAFRIARSRPLLQTVNSRPSAAHGKEKTARRGASWQPMLVQDAGVALLDGILLFLFFRLVTLLCQGEVADHQRVNPGAEEAAQGVPWRDHQRLATGRPAQLLLLQD